jgi:hypothetical protein
MEKGITVIENGLLHRWYMFMLPLWRNFKGTDWNWDWDYDYGDYDHDNVNLCFFARVCFFYPLLILMCNILAWGLAAGALIAPFVLFSTGALLTTFLYILVIAAVIIGIIVVVYLFVEEQVYRNCEAYRVAKSWIKAIEQKICPYVYFVKREKEDVEN